MTPGLTLLSDDPVIVALFMEWAQSVDVISEQTMPAELRPLLIGEGA